MCKTLDAHQGILLGDVNIGRRVQLRHDVLWELSMLFAWGPWPTVWQRPQVAREIVDFPAWGIGPWQCVADRCTQPCELTAQTQVGTPGRLRGAPSLQTSEPALDLNSS
jgi:hypothetical protein